MDEPKKATKLLSLDLSTTCTGFATFDVASGKLEEWGTIKPSMRGGVAKLLYPRQQLVKMIDIARQVKDLLERVDPTVVVIEEIAGSKNRLGQKTLDGLHFIVAWVIEEYLDRVHYYDVTGAVGWRSADLKLRLSEADKLANKEAVKLNKKLPKSQALPKIGPKHLAQRYVNAKFGLGLDIDTRPTDADIGDAVAMGDSFLTHRLPKLFGGGTIK